MPRTPHFHILGVPTRVRPIAALPGLLMAALIYTLARRLARESPAWLLALTGALAWYEADLIHVAGHIASSRLIDAPMDYVRWGFFAINGYAQHDVTPQQHIGRSLGGPVASGLAAIGYWLAWRMFGRTLLGKVALIACIQNTVTALGSLAPLSIIDGGVIYANLRQLTRDA
ncbi:MAG TPA: hypothetical protein VFO07_01425 [Roseiflexaceae bacterium]|nr:hypothetical protein [Roseiflexaceae bacterium]